VNTNLYSLSYNRIYSKFNATPIETPDGQSFSQTDLEYETARQAVILSA